MSQRNILLIGGTALLASAGLAVIAMSSRKKKKPAFKPTRIPVAGTIAKYRLTSIIRPEGHFVGGVTAFDAADTGLENDTTFANFMNSNKTNQTVCYCFDVSARVLVFLSCPSREALWREPFLDRGIRKLASEDVFICSFETAHAYVRENPKPRPDATLQWIWNTGRCGSTLMSRVMVASGNAVSLSEPWWFDELCFAIDDGALPEAELDELVKTLHVVDFKLASDMWPEATVFSMNPKGKGHPVRPSILRAFPDGKHMFMYRDSRKVVESFGSIFSNNMPWYIKFAMNLGLGAPPINKKAFSDPRLSEMFENGDLRLPKRLNPIAQRITAMWVDSVSSWIRLRESEPLLGDSVTIRMDEFVTKDLDKRRENVRAVLKSVGIEGKESIELGMTAFNKHSQAGTRMATSSASAGTKKFLTAEDADSIAEFVASIPGMKADMVIPGSLAA